MNLNQTVAPPIDYIRLSKVLYSFIVKVCNLDNYSERCAIDFDRTHSVSIKQNGLKCRSGLEPGRNGFNQKKRFFHSKTSFLVFIIFLTSGIHLFRCLQLLYKYDVGLPRRQRAHDVLTSYEKGRFMNSRQSIVNGLDSLQPHQLNETLSRIEAELEAAGRRLKDFGSPFKDLVFFIEPPILIAICLAIWTFFVPQLIVYFSSRRDLFQMDTLSYEESERKS